MTAPVPVPARMAMVTTAHPWGDPRVFERELAACLAWGVEAHVFMPLAEWPGRPGWGADGRLVLHRLAVPGGRLQRFRLALGVWREVLRHGPFPLIHFHDPELLPAMALLALLRPESYLLYDIHEDLPLQLESKDYLPDGLRMPVARLAGWMLRTVRELFGGFAPATEAIGKDWPAARTRVVHNYPKALFSEASGPGLGLGPDPNRILYSGGLSRLRGIPLAVAAVREARRQLPDLRLELVGWVMDEESGRAIEAAVAEGWCLHLPRVPARTLMERARGAGVGLVTLLPCPNYLQSLPTKLFEYMAMGIPVLASDFPLWRRLVVDAGAGRVTVPEPAAVAAALVEMCSGPGRLARHGEAGRVAYRERYRWEVEASNLRWHLLQAGLPLLDEQDLSHR
jgi:glycosyltransferase involved in cell wall biosynthesis